MKFDTSNLNQLMKKMGAEESNWRFKSSLTDLEKEQIKSADGLELNLEDLEKHVMTNGMVVIDGHPAVLWIKNTENAAFKLENDPLQEGIKRFHIYADCSTMKNMKKQGKFNKYAVGHRQDGSFNVIGQTGRSWRNPFRKNILLKDIKLGVCMNCLSKAGYDTSNSRQARIDFNIKDFFALHGQEKFLKPKFNDDNYPFNEKDYGREYEIKSKQYKKYRNYKCEECNVDLSQLRHRYLYHTHHEDSNKHHNDFDNFKALCATCHQKEHRHGMIGEKDVKKCRNLRKEQGLDEN